MLIDPKTKDDLIKAIINKSKDSEFKIEFE
jgi:hypothetical protein